MHTALGLKTLARAAAARTSLAGLVALALAGAAAAQTAACPDAAPLEAKLKAAPGDVAAMINLGRAYLCSKRLADAQATLEDAVALSYPNFDAHYYLGLVLFQRGDLDAALYEFVQLSTLYPERLEPLNNQGVVYARLRKPDDAIRAFGAAVEAGKKASAPVEVIVEIQTNLAAQQRVKGDYLAAAQTYANALDLRPGDPALVLARAQALFDGGKGTDALPLVSDLRVKNPANVAATLLIADIYAQQSLPDRALRELERTLSLVKTGDERASLQLKRGLLLQSLGRKADAVAAFRAAATANPEAWEAQYNLGAALLADKPADALAAFRAAAKLRPDDGETQLGIAAAQDALRNYAAAYTAARNAMPLLNNPTLRSRARFLAGKSAYQAGQYKDAETELGQLVKSDPNTFDYQLWYGLTEYALKDYPDAITALENATRLAPSSTLARVNLGAAYLAAKRYGDAEQLMRTVLAVEPDNASALTNLGLALANLNRIEEARTALNRAASLGSGEAKRALEALNAK
jgi:tetratricopeptide (TPR) repeat protein